MEFFIDTANLSEIKEANELGIIDGVTTNPSLMAKEGIKGKEATQRHYRMICDLVRNNVSAEVIATDTEGMTKEGRELSRIDDKIIVKVPMTQEGIRAIRIFRSEGIRTNCTLVFSVGQAILAAKAGANYVSPFVGRLDDFSYNGIELVEQISQVYENYSYSTKILAASIRHTKHLIECAEVGADVATCPLSVLMGLFKHPLTELGLKKFLDDHNSLTS